MAKQDRRSGGLGALLAGLLVGVLIVAVAYLFLNRDRQAPEAVNPPVATAPADTPPPVAAPPAPPAPTAPARPPGAAATPAPPPLDDAQIADDAAATGMTGPVNPPVDQPSY